MNEDYLIEYLESQTHTKFADIKNKQDKIRALTNVAMPTNFSNEFYTKQDEYLQGLLKDKVVTSADEILGNKQIALFLGDITTIKADAIVNAGNSELLGCFAPLHYCIDNAIHSFGGLQIRRDLIPIMQKQNYFEENGKCKVTKGYNLPIKYVFHTVGPVYNGEITPTLENDLESCYLSCLKKADEMKLKHIVFCSISTGIFGFPIETASEIAIKTVENYLKTTKSKLKVIFNLFSQKDYEIYERKF